MTPSTDLPASTLENPASALENQEHTFDETAAVPEFANPPRTSFTSPIRVEANRRNAKKSTGPRTEEGKKASRLNASRHYLTGQVRILPDDERHAVEALCNPIMDSLAPVGESELHIARDIAEGHWRLARARAIEDNLYADHIGNRADSPIAGDNPQIADAFHIAHAFAHQPDVFNKLSLVEQRIQKAVDRNYKLLTGLQTQRRALEQKALEDAKSVFLYRRQQGKAHDPESEAKANGGFVFPIAHVDALVARDFEVFMGRRIANTPTPMAKAA